MKGPITADDLSRWETCSRLPELYATYSQHSDHLPVRDACKRAFYSALSHRPFDPELAEAQFLLAAANEGYAYPEWTEPYTVGKDHVSWLSGALHLAAELNLYPIKRTTDCPVRVQAFEDDLGGVHTFRVVQSLPLTLPTKWPELTLLAYYYPASLTVHALRLPRIGDLGRLHSPLSFGYQHPLTGLYRLSRFDSTRGFGPKWRRKGRWEAADDDQVSWEEWRNGIDNDKCLEQCMRHYDIPTGLDADERDQIKADLTVAVNQLQQSFVSLPRKREMCTTCIVRETCHKLPVVHPDQRRESAEENMQSMR